MLYDGYEGGTRLDILITEWALNSYLDLKHKNLFTAEEYWGTIRPDIELLKTAYPNDPKFGNGKFWSQATLKGHPIPDGFKMKWHQVGPGLNQLRTPVTIQGSGYLCEAYKKIDEKCDRRAMLRFKTHIQLIRESKVHIHGRLK